jgi:hypothetical protein
MGIFFSGRTFGTAAVTVLFLQTEVPFVPYISFPRRGEGAEP